MEHCLRGRCGTARVAGRLKGLDGRGFDRLAAGGITGEQASPGCCSNPLAYWRLEQGRAREGTRAGTMSPRASALGAVERANASGLHRIPPIASTGPAALTCCPASGDPLAQSVEHLPFKRNHARRRPSSHAPAGHRSTRLRCELSRFHPPDRSGQEGTGADR